MSILLCLFLCAVSFLFGVIFGVHDYAKIESERNKLRDRVRELETFFGGPKK
jgi:uncharacterized protein YneF (UPF0154 family)